MVWTGLFFGPYHLMDWYTYLFWNISISFPFPFDETIQTLSTYAMRCYKKSHNVIVIEKASQKSHALCPEVARFRF